MNEAAERPDLDGLSIEELRRVIERAEEREDLRQAGLEADRFPREFG